MKNVLKVRGAAFPGLRLGTLALLFFLLHNCAVAQTPTLLGDLDADRTPTVIDLQRLLNHLSGRDEFHLVPNLVPYADLNEDGVVNTNDVLLLQDAILGRRTLPNPYAAPVVSVPTFSTNGTFVTITGTARPNRRIIITGGRLAVFANSDSNGLFSAEVQLRANQVNAIYVTATNATFAAGIPQPLRVLQDSQPPNLYIDFPTNGATLYTDSTVIAGRVGDSLSGFLGLTVRTRSTASQIDLPAVVDVGIGNNGTYQRSNFPLEEGTNVIRVTATDIHGNQTNREITVIRRPLAGPRLLVLSGDGQKTNVHRRLADPIIVKATQADGITPLANTLVTFEVTRSDGRLLPLTPTALADPVAFTNDINRTPHGVMRVTLRTDAVGTARVWWALGGDAGCGNNRVCVMSAGISNAVYFCASADAALPKQINIGTGNNQKAETGGFLPEPLRAWVNDSCNGNQEMPVTFTVIQGGGRLYRVGDEVTSLTSTNGNQSLLTSTPTSITVPTTRTGHAEVLFQLGPDAGQNIVEANYPGNPNLPATFIAYGVARDSSKPTTLTGLLLDNTSQPIGGATCRVSVGGQMFTTTTDTQGRFAFNSSTLEPFNLSTLPSGPAQLFVNGSTATNLLGVTIPTNSYPSLEFQLILIPNAENSLPSPVLLPKLNLANQRLYYGTNDLVLTCEGMEGLKMTIKAGSMRKPDGTQVTPSNPSFVSLNQVHHDNVPMPIPDGASPPFAWTLQPGGATFDPPVQVEYPNMSGLPAGTIAYFLSYNHDTRRFEIICSGHVREDSATIVSDPGAGLTLAGWGCNCPPYSVTARCKQCNLNPTQQSIRPAGGNPTQIEDTVEFEPKDLAALFGPRHPCGQTLVWFYPELRCSCDPNNANRDTLLSVNIRAKVKHKWYWDKIQGSPDSQADIDDVKRHENIHLQKASTFFESIQSDLAQFNGISNPDELQCAKALERALDFYISRYKEYVADQQAVETSSEGAKCRNLKAKYAGGASAFAGVGPEPADCCLPDSESHTRPLDGSDWVMSVNGQSGGFRQAFGFHLANISAPDQFGQNGPSSPPDFLSDDFFRVVAVTTEDGVSRYGFSEFFQMRQGETTLVDGLTFTDIPPRKPESLSIRADSQIMTVAGRTNQLHVIARYSDGTTNDVTARTSWTSYRVSNPNIAIPDASGLITALNNGSVFVSAVNEGVIAVTRLSIVTDITVTRITGRVELQGGSILPGVQVEASGIGLAALTDSSGSFLLERVPVALAPIRLILNAVVSGRRYVATFTATNLIVGGVTDIGVVTLKPFEFRTGSMAAGGTPFRGSRVNGTHSFALKADGSVFGWGWGQSGQLGNGMQSGGYIEVLPGRVAGDDWQQVAVGGASSHTMGLMRGGALYGWGRNDLGQLGQGDTRNQTLPRLTGEGWQFVAAGAGRTAGITTNGALWIWGAGQTLPSQIGTDRDWLSTSIAVGHQIAIKQDGRLYGWGSFQPNGQVGVASNWVSAVCGSNYTVALTADGSIWSWGVNASGQLGTGSTVAQPSPTNAIPGNDWVAIAAGDDHSFAIKADGTLWSWGDNRGGQFGDGTRIGSLVPVQRLPGHDWVGVVCGYQYTLALTADGRMFGWGRNDTGQLGVGDSNDRLFPELIPSASPWGVPQP